MGWNFYKTGRQPGDKFKQADLDLMDKYDPGTGLDIDKLYNLEEEKDKMQGIFSKETN
ncbi:hypothetical protein FC54_GL001551 [Ligilactobacillus saerimneri DSM 16049]|nr:hypothetical protein FC54_GL001551 [Ligilactobacillus saerimneri DSM 16049]